MASVLLALLALGCESEDPRLPQSLYDEAMKINNQGKILEAKTMMEMIAQRYPNSTAGTQAQKDLYLLDSLLKQDIQDRQKQLHTSMRRTADALSRFRTKFGEYPNTLDELVPDFVEKTPEAPWGHPFLYRPYVRNPIEEFKGKRGAVSQRVNSRWDGYFLACLGVDMQPGGTDMAADSIIVDGEFYKERLLPMIPMPQPVK